MYTILENAIFGSYSAMHNLHMYITSYHFCMKTKVICNTRQINDAFDF